MKFQPISRKVFCNKITKLLYLAIPIFLSISLLFIGCDCKNDTLPDVEKSYSDSSDSSSWQNHDTANSNTLDVVQNQRPIFFLAHGLGDTASCFNFLVSELPKKCPGAWIILSKSVEGKTHSLSIEEQAEQCHKEFSSEVSDISDAKQRPIILIGHSQGGLRVSALAPKLEKEGYNVKIVGINTPFEGAPLLRFENETSLKQYIRDRLNSVCPSLLRSSLTNIMNHAADQLVAFVTQCFGEYDVISKEPGVKDLKLGNSFFRRLQSKLSRANIPILAIAGAVDSKIKIDLSTIFGIDLPDQAKFFNFNLNDCLKNVLADVLVGQTNHSDKRHDCTLPVYSQHGSNTIAKSQNYYKVTIDNTVHISNFIPGITGTLDSPQTVAEIQQFAKR
ncbi:MULTISPECIES: hypothetical protein [unclassified Candidatus Cardinium]|uniref:hypothetical protein n=1 Tax=unclassified Candidatus Cardinium TaxID=2641185 RepID=UPI001FB54BA1|nr:MULTISPECIES: hypothetical protein [unclassified Candidatus Cardinium]